MRSVLRVGLFGCTAVAALAGVRTAQGQVTLTLSSAPAVFPAPTAADYTAGVVSDPTGIGFTITVGGPKAARTSIVFIRSTSAVLGGTKPLSDLEWRRADLATWTPMSLTDATIESRPIVKNQTNDPWSNQVLFRIRLSWTADPPATYAANLVFTLTVTTP